jgi:hypothetical protein
LNAAQSHLLERLLPRLAEGLGKEAGRLAGQDRKAVHAWLKGQLAELLPEAPR